MLVDKLGQASNRIRADAEHSYATLFQFGLGIANAAGLGGTAWGEGLGVEKNHHWVLVPEGSQLNQVAVLIRQFEVGGQIANLGVCHVCVYFPCFG